MLGTSRKREIERERARVGTRKNGKEQDSVKEGKKQGEEGRKSEKKEKETRIRLG